MSKYMNMNEIIEYIKQNTELNTENRIRENLIEIFEMLNIDRNLLKKNTKDGEKYTKEISEYSFPVKSKEFLVWLVSSFTDEDFKEMRRGNFHKANINKMKKVIKGFEKMFEMMELPELVLRQQLIKVYTRTKLPMLESKNKIFKVLQDMKLDLEVENNENDMPLDTEINFEHSEIYQKQENTKKFMYFKPFDNVGLNDQLIFMNMIYEDYVNLQQRHREIYRILSDIRSEEIFDMSLRQVNEMSSEEEEHVILQLNYSIMIQDELNKNSRYKELVHERDKLLKTNNFVKKIESKYNKICEELSNIEEYTQIKMFGEIVLIDNSEEIDFENMMTSDQALEEAIKYFEEQENSYKEYLERISKITPEERESTRIAINKILNEKGMPLIDNFS